MERFLSQGLCSIPYILFLNFKIILQNVWMPLSEMETQAQKGRVLSRGFPPSPCLSQDSNLATWPRVFVEHALCILVQYLHIAGVFLLIKQEALPSAGRELQYPNRDCQVPSRHQRTGVFICIVCKARVCPAAEIQHMPLSLPVDTTADDRCTTSTREDGQQCLSPSSITRARLTYVLLHVLLGIVF